MKSFHLIYLNYAVLPLTALKAKVITNHSLEP